MIMRPILNSFNRGIMICDLGSINYHQNNFNAAVLYYVLQCAFILCGLKIVYDGNKMVRNIFKCI